MKIRHLSIHNYRSIHCLELDTLDWMVLLGPNNHGKSNLMSAIEFLLSGGFKPIADDFFEFCDEGDTELWVDAIFDELTEQERHTFSKYVRRDGTVKIRKFARADSSGGTEVGYRGYLEDPKSWWLKSSAFERLGSREKVEAEAKDVPALATLLGVEGRITKQRVEDFRAEYIAQHNADIEYEEMLEENPLLGRANVASGVLPDFYLVPAVRDLGDETKVTSKTLFGRLIQRAVQAMTETDERFIELQDRFAQLVEELNQRGEIIEGAKFDLAQLEADLTKELKAWGVSVSIQLESPGMEKLFELGTQLHVDDGHKTVAERKGHGLQRAVIFALLRTWAKALRAKPGESETSARKASESAIFAIEEPELFLHPHAQRQLARDLRDIAATPGNQVFICSHSTHFVNLDQYKSIVIIRKDNVRKGTTAKQCTRELFEGEDAENKKHRFHMASWVNPDRGELFFARKVVLVEGETEHAIFPFLASKLGCFDPSVTIVDCGSKRNLLLYIRILNAYGIGYVVVHDQDPLPDPIPDDWDEAKTREKRRNFELNEKIAAEVCNDVATIHILSPDFEGASGVSKCQGEKMGKAIAALEHFSPLPVGDIPVSLQNLVRSLYCQD